MKLESFDTAAQFLQAAGEWLAAAERENNLLLSVLHGAVRRGDLSLGWLVREQETPRLALFQVPPHYLLLSQGSADAALYAAEGLEAQLPGVVGPAPLADAWVQVWTKRRVCAASLNSAMTFYTLDRVESYVRPAGVLRRARMDEFASLASLCDAAARDMKLPAEEQEPEEVRKGLRRAMVEGRQYVWAEGESIRAIASYVQSLPGAGARIRGVYTPSELRGRGYGTAVTGALAAWLLQEGQAWVSLFADNANPTSTGIYRRLGFRPELVFRSWRFE